MAAFLLTEVILRLKNACPLFEGRVAGVQSFVAATGEDVDIATPCAFVVPMYDTAEAREGGMYSQKVTERFAVIVCADNSKDARKGRGYSAEVVLRSGRQQIANALLNWAPVNMQAMDPVQYGRSQHLFMNNARIYHQYEFTCGYYFAGSEDPQDDAGYEAIQRIIMGGWPDVDAAQITKVMTNKASRETINPNDESTYEVIYEAVYGTNPDWIRFRPHNAFEANTAQGEDTVLGQPGHRTVEP